MPSNHKQPHPTTVRSGYSSQSIQIPSHRLSHPFYLTNSPSVQAMTSPTPTHSPKTVLITGANGYIGNAVARAFVRAAGGDWLVYGLIRSTSSRGNHPQSSAPSTTLLLPMNLNLSWRSYYHPVVLTWSFPQRRVFGLIMRRTITTSWLCCGV